jgi:hypothetical protein
MGDDMPKIRDWRWAGKRPATGTKMKDTSADNV